jgi:hypothetical protein
MHKALRCTCSQKPPLLSPSFLISFDLTQSLLLDLCHCNPLSSLLIGVECNSLYSSVHLHYATNNISLYFFSWCITPDYCCLVDGSVDLWILDLLLPHSSNISLALVSSSFFPLLSFSCLLFVADCHVKFPPFLLHSHFVTLSNKLTFPLFLCTLRVPPSGSMGACSW